MSERERLDLKESKGSKSLKELYVEKVLIKTKVLVRLKSGSSHSNKGT